MLRLVMKFGGTSVGSVERINEVANIVRNEVVQGNEVVVVLSAMAGETDRLVNLARGISDSLSPAEYGHCSIFWRTSKCWPIICSLK